MTLLFGITSPATDCINLANRGLATLLEGAGHLIFSSAIESQILILLWFLYRFLSV